MDKTIVLMGWSSSGKDCSIEYLSNKYNIPISISNTTRPRRNCETEGVEYNFMTENEFNSQDYMMPPRIYHSVFGDWLYGTSLDVKGKLVILDYSGTKHLCNKLGRENIIVIKLNASKAIIKRRYVGRGDNISEVNRRIADDIIVFEGSDEYADYIINNNGTSEELFDKLDEVMGVVL